jgi:hypothetical protein
MGGRPKGNQARLSLLQWKKNQMNPDTNNYDDIGELCVELERQNEQLANEVAGLRELLNRALECLKVYGGILGVEAAKQISEELAPAPEEPVIKESLTTEPALDWRELGPDEVPQVGDEWYSDIGKRWVTSIGSSGEKVSRFGGIRFRTRRPLPVQEMPLEDELKRIEWYQNYSEVTIYHALADAIRYLRDEIEALKKNQK